jgi:farnesyl-diphosphate farnesyltransferase
MSRQHESGRPEGDAADLRWCHEAVQGVSRTFALTVDVLEEPMSSYICVGYLLCRIPDTVEDAGHIPPADQASILRAYDAALDPDAAATVDDFRAAVADYLPPAAGRSDDWEVVAEAPRVVRTFDSLPADVREAIAPPARELVQGMAMFVERYADAEGLRIETGEELEEYCYYAAGTVGHLITNLVTRGDVSPERRRRLYDRAEEFGLLLQLVNIGKDVYDDYTAENNVYVPSEWLADEGVPQEEVLDPRHESAAAGAVRRVADHARGFVDDALRYLEEVPTTDGNTLAAWAIPFLLAVGTLRELSARPEDALTDAGVKVTRQEVYAVVSAMTGDAGRESLSDLRDAVARQPFHHAATSAD